MVCALQYRRNWVSRNSAGTLAAARRASPGRSRPVVATTSVVLGLGELMPLLPIDHRMRDMQVADQSGAGRAKLGVGLAGGVGVDKIADALAKLGQLRGGDVQDGVAELRGPLPLLRLICPGFEPAVQALDVTVGDDVAQQIGRGIHLRVGGDLWPAREHSGGAPWPLAPCAAA